MLNELEHDDHGYLYTPNSTIDENDITSVLGENINVFASILKVQESGPLTSLSYFAQIHQEYGDTIDVIAMHSDMVTDDVQAFIDAEGLDLPFALDETGDVIKSLGGSTQLPMTVIVDQSGKIVYNQVGSVTYEKLKSLIDPLL